MINKVYIVIPYPPNKYELQYSNQKDITKLRKNANEDKCWIKHISCDENHDSAGNPLYGYPRFNARNMPIEMAKQEWTPPDADAPP